MLSYGRMKLSNYNYELPEELIAIHPPKVRGTSRLLVLDKNTGEVTHAKYAELDKYLNPGDVLVLNDTKVIKARLIADNSKGQIRELLLLEDHHNTDFSKRKAIYRGGISEGEILKVNNYDVRIDKVLEGGICEISSSVNLLDLAEHEGSVPLPPYMHREADESDIERYQTVFAKQPGSVAAPTASLNFTEELQTKLTNKGVQIAYITLHVGLGTFLPIRTDDIEEHTMHSEYFEVPEETVNIINKAVSNRCNIVALGTTVTRTLEFLADDILSSKNEKNKKLSGECDIFIYPGYKFKLVSAMLTNFHAPKSTVLMMAAAFAGWENLKNSYEIAKQENYSFLSYGDSMFIK
jgi:S-adenosylmethionine:tRNA ribosyltransferase-isomerase